MDLSDILANSADQERGKWFELLDPVTGDKTGMRLKIAGPDSVTRNAARLAHSDELMDRADAAGKVTAKDREAARLNFLAKTVLDWDVLEDNLALGFSHANVLRLLKAGTWVQEQVDSWADDRAAYREGL